MYSEAEESYTRAQELYARIGNDLGRADTLRYLGHLHRQQARKMESAQFYAQARDLYSQIRRLDDAKDASDWLAVVTNQSGPPATMHLAPC
ncbi:hypothetical protein M407DRAFT_246330 [Tulasnella calospora MUT 4182]|uniref:Anaphase-promoting complex subunit 5 domain-containing protein n=1 Tax=Tulasnella calospora MUT 4182 TaxID=1051891 RepID=A0A0C3KC27_9AGAM|nr:hypothetical protein M407DRAFT_246330 [Tulasnella calospora MUT 4182]